MEALTKVLAKVLAKAFEVTGLSDVLEVNSQTQQNGREEGLKMFLVYPNCAIHKSKMTLYQIRMP